MNEQPPGRARRKPDGRSVGRVSRQDWVDAARRALIDGGVDAIKVDRLARQMNITRGSFYWHFSARSDLLDALLNDWAGSAVVPFREAYETADGAPDRQLRQLLALFTGDGGLDPAHEAAMRGWARLDPETASVVRSADAERIGLLEQVFVALGFDGDEAQDRARIGYYHQIGASFSVTGDGGEHHGLLSGLLNVIVRRDEDAARALAQFA